MMPAYVVGAVGVAVLGVLIAEVVLRAKIRRL